LNPNYATAHHWLVVYVLRPLLRLDEALAEIKRAQELDPLSPAINASMGEKLSLVGKHDLGIQVLQKQIAIDPSFLLAHRILGQVYFSIGKLPEAAAELETMHRLDGNGTYGLEYLGFIYAGAGRTNEAQKLLGQLLELQRQGLDYRVGIALVQHALGDDGLALESLDMAFAERLRFGEA
jgi:tetratricopeptide (TPR) repeat protein